MTEVYIKYWIQIIDVNYAYLIRLRELYKYFFSVLRKNVYLYVCQQTFEDFLYANLSWENKKKSKH